MNRTPVRRIAALAAVAALLAACSAGGSAAPIVPPIPSGTPAASAPASGAASSSTDPNHAGGGLPGCPTAGPAPFTAADAATVTFVTPKGSIVIKVKGDLAPYATANFVALAKCGYYDNVVFHRLVPTFVIQGGDGQFGRQPNLDTGNIGFGGPGYTIADDPVTTTYHRGTVAMARSRDPHSEGSQFFIVLSDAAAPALSSANTYAILGEVSSGMDAVDAIAAMPNSGDPNNAALNPIAITSTTVTAP